MFIASLHNVGIFILQRNPKSVQSVISKFVMIEGILRDKAIFLRVFFLTENKINFYMLQTIDKVHILFNFITC